MKARDRLYQWDLALAHAWRDLSPAQLADFEAWREAHREGSDANWPGWLQILGPRPRLRVVPDRRTA